MYIYIYTYLFIYHNGFLFKKQSIVSGHLLVTTTQKSIYVMWLNNDSSMFKQCHKPAMTGNGNHPTHKDGDFVDVS